MDVRDFDFDLPAELIAQQPARDRAAARLLVVNREAGALAHTTIAALPDLLASGELVVVNNTKVFPARLLGRRLPSGGAVECLLIGRLRSESSLSQVGVGSESGRSRVGVDADQSQELWEALMHPGQKLRPGARVVFEGTQILHGEVLDRRFFGRRVIRLWTDDGSSLDEAIDAIGHVPLPPYIKRADCVDDRDRYQTVYARSRGSVAAPTAGLHFTTGLIDALTTRGVGVAEITLHVGYGTFQPVRVERVEDHRVEPERYTIDAATAARINDAVDTGRRVVAVGTTTTRALEGVAGVSGGRIRPGSGETDLFIFPGFAFRIVGGLLTNFHLPRSSLLMLVSAFAGRELVLSAYKEAIAQRYRFYSYGDAMLIL